MLIIYRYLSLEFLTKTLIAAGILNFVLVLQNVFKYAMDKIVNEDYPITIIFKFLFLLLPYLLSFSLPWSVLVATLLIFGRLSADHELTAMRASGISMWHIASPFIIIGLVFTFLSIYINGEIAPRCELAYRTLFARFAVEKPTALFESDKFLSQIPNVRIYVGQKSGNRIENVHIYQIGSGEYPVTNIRAAWGEIISSSSESKKVKLVLHNVRMESRATDDPENLARLQYGRVFDEYEMVFDLDQILKEKLLNKKLSQFTFGELFHEMRTQPERKKRAEALVEFHKRLSLPFACFTFILIGMPLGIQLQRSEKSVGILVSFLVAMIYYIFVAVGETLRARTDFYPELILWAPNFLFQTAGLLLLWRQHRV